MFRRTLLTGAAALAVTPAFAQPAVAQTGRTRVVFWHAMNAPLGDEVNKLVAAFNASQTEVEVVPVFKGTYPETLTAAIAAWRAGQAPNVVQMFEVGTGSMLAAGPAVKQVWELAKDTGVALDPEQYIGAVRGYYSLPDGRLASAPFNSSTAMFWIDADAFEKAGLDPAKPPATWDDFTSAARALKTKAGAAMPSTTSWFSWIQFEQFAAIHNIPYATEENGFKGLNAELLINKAPFVNHLNRLLEMSKEGLFKYTGRDNAPDPLFSSGQATMSFNSSGSRSEITKNAKFKWREALLPYDPALIKEPINSVIGGASLWAMTTPNRTMGEYKGAAEFLKFLSEPKQVAQWSQATGYVPVTSSGYDLLKQDGYYANNPGADLPVEQLRRGTVTPNSKGFRLGRMAELRNIQYEEVEKAFQGQQTAQAALDSAVSRGNKVLREFEKANKA
jgi:sn-glycerol 3-phosphate transport system substrate-binding protein